jgi:Tol biopolymer transport system component
MDFLKFLTIVILALHTVGSYAVQPQSTLKHCLDQTVPPLPLSQINFDGILFISSEDGTRAIRNPIPTTYIIAPSDHYRSFGSSGSFSPDGKWFAYPTGTSGRANWVARHYQYERINFINTYTGQRVFYVPTDEGELFVGRSYPIQGQYATVNWLSNTQYILDNKTVVNVETQTSEEYTGDTPLNTLLSGMISPDGTQVITYGDIIDATSGEVVVRFENPSHSDWLKNGTGYYFVSSKLDKEYFYNTYIYNRDGSLRFSQDVYGIVSQTGQWLGWNEGIGKDSNTAYNSFIKNTQNNQTVELCANVRSIAFSPDDTQAAILTLNENDKLQLWMINLDTWESTSVDVYINLYSTLVGWWRN